MKKKFPFYKQPDSKDCGPTCLKIIAKYYGKLISLKEIRDLSETTRSGSSLLKLSEAADAIGFRSLGLKTDFIKLAQAPLPLIVHWRNSHFIVVYKVKRNKVFVSDPAYGLITYSKQEFIKGWIGPDAQEDTRDGIILLLELTPKFKNQDWEDQNVKSFGFLSQYLFKYKSLVLQLIIGLLVGSLLQLIFPFLTQSIVDIGIQNQDIGFIYLILAAQGMLFIGRTAIEVFRSWILLHLSTRINISLVSDFFVKLMNLPIAFFDTRMAGDIMQRIQDNRRIEELLTGSALNTMFSFFNLLVFGGVLFFYSPLIFMIFFIGSLLYIGWILFFLKRRKELDYKRFSVLGQEQSKVMELINGMQEIKMNNAEKQKRWSWEFIQAKLFKVSIKNLALEQFQGVGSSFINEAKNIIITFSSALLVIDGNITLGMMLSIQYIIGQLNSPIMQLVTFIRSLQDAKISLERLGEIHDKKDEDETQINNKINIQFDKPINLKKVSFKYTGTDNYVLKDLSLNIPAKKTTAIVGASGSGKTTILKLLLKFYQPDKGNLYYGEDEINTISHKLWRDNCGVVMQDGYIFNDTIAHNIAIGEDSIDDEKLIQAAKTANIYEFIQSLPLQFNSPIGNEGIGISAGQRQRLFIARAVYKNPKIILFDEATSALDAKNERVIMQKLNDFFKDRTVIVIAHRLSTVKNADQIVVVDEGEIKETGNHTSLINKEGYYFELIKNQLALETINS